MDNESLTNYKLEQIYTKLGELVESIEILGERLRKIEHHLYNDSETDSDGIVKRVHKIEARLKTLEDKDKVREVKIGIWGTVGGFAVMFVWELTKYFLNQHK